MRPLPPQEHAAKIVATGARRVVSLPRPRARFDREPARVERRARPGERGARSPGRASTDVEAPSGLVEALREFRRAEAQARSIPAFRVLTDRVLYAIAQERPTSEAQLLRVHGVGPSLAKNYGSRLLRIMQAGD